MATGKNDHDPSIHTRKRQYQPSIISFFNRDAEPSRSHRVVSLLSPPLPADTQASLLSVGMRVRKSVPEGYKTHKTVGTAGFRFPSSAPAVIATPNPAYNASVPRELAPLCGLHKVGGWAEQQPSSSAPAWMGSQIKDDEDAMPELSMSQSTMHSARSSFIAAGLAELGSKKRSYEDETEANMDAIFARLEDEEDAVIGHRIIAQPRGMLKRAVIGGVAVQGSGVDDFEEAGFLVPVEGMDVDEAGL